MPRTLWVLVVVGLSSVSCRPEGETLPTPAAPAATPAAETSVSPLGASTPAAPEPTPPLAPPVMAKLVEVTAAGTKIPMGSACDVYWVSWARGSGLVEGRAPPSEVLTSTMKPGDALTFSGYAAPGTLEIKGTGLAVLATALHDCPDAGARPRNPVFSHSVSAATAKDLSWAGGTMHAHLDLEKELSPEVYVGRLEGTAAVAEHDHPSSWEILCAIEGSGTFTLDGVPKHVAAPVIIAVPPGRKHSWQPDPGVKLVAVQLYAPPGPEQRFKALASKP